MIHFPKSRVNPNHHSVVVRVDCGEGGGLNLMLSDYAGNIDIFNGDALDVSHHGAEYASTQGLLEATTPCLAFMGAGGT